MRSTLLLIGFALGLALSGCGGGQPASKSSGMEAACRCVMDKSYNAAQNRTVHLLTWAKPGSKVDVTRGDEIRLIFAYVTEGKPEEMGKRIGGVILYLWNTHAGPQHRSGPGKGIGITVAQAQDKLHTGVMKWTSVPSKKPGKVTDAFQMILPDDFVAGFRNTQYVGFQLKKPDGSPASAVWSTNADYVGGAQAFFQTMPARK